MVMGIRMVTRRRRVVVLRLRGREVGVVVDEVEVGGVGERKEWRDVATCTRLVCFMSRLEGIFVLSLLPSIASQLVIIQLSSM